MQAFSAAGAGFLMAVLWFDLMFDVQVLRNRDEVNEDVIASISAYYRRVTTEAQPMGRLVALVMVATIASVVAEVAGTRVSSWAAWSSLVLVIGAVALAGARTVPRAVRLGSRRDPVALQETLARSILRDHLACLVAITTVIVVQLAWAR